MDQSVSYTVDQSDSSGNVRRTTNSDGKSRRQKLKAYRHLLLRKTNSVKDSDAALSYSAEAQLSSIHNSRSAIDLQRSRLGRFLACYLTKISDLEKLLRSDTDNVAVHTLVKGRVCNYIGRRQ